MEADMEIEERIAEVRDRMDRPPAARSIRAGLDTIGENYVQEIRDKGAAGAYEGARVHMIGHLQKNKVRYVAGQVDMIESVDSAELLALIGKRAASLGKVQDVLLEINIGGEAAKSGLEPDRLESVLETAAGTEGVRVRGLMTIPPEEDSVLYFPRMYHLFIDTKQKKYDNVSMEFLSMGMSGDYEEAIREGANMVRVGSRIFGPRNYT